MASDGNSWYFIPPSLLVLRSSKCIWAKPRLPDALRAEMVEATPNCEGHNSFHQPIKSLCITPGELSFACATPSIYTAPLSPSFAATIDGVLWNRNNPVFFM